MRFFGWQTFYSIILITHFLLVRFYRASKALFKIIDETGVKILCLKNSAGYFGDGVSRYKTNKI